MSNNHIILKSLRGNSLVSNVLLTDTIEMETDLQLTEDNAFDIGTNDKRLKKIHTTNLETENITTNNLLINTKIESLYLNTIGSIITFPQGSISIASTENMSNLGMTVYKNYWEDIKDRVYDIVGNYLDEKTDEVVEEIKSNFSEENDLNLISFTEILSILENIPENVEDFFNDIYDILFTKVEIDQGMIIRLPLKITENTFIDEKAIKPYIRDLFSAKMTNYENLLQQPFVYNEVLGEFSLSIDKETIKINESGQLYSIQPVFDANTFNTIGNKINITLNTNESIISTGSGLETNIELQFPLQYYADTLKKKIEFKYNPYDFQVGTSTIGSNYFSINLNTSNTLITTSNGLTTNFELSYPLEYNSNQYNNIRLKYNPHDLSIDSGGNLYSANQFAYPLFKTQGSIQLLANTMFENNLDNELNLKIDLTTLKQKTAGTLYVSLSSQNPLLTYSTTGNINLNITKGNAIFLSTAGNINLSHASSLSISNNKLFTNISSQTSLITYNNSTGVLNSTITGGNYISISSGVISSTITQGNAIDISPITSVLNVKYDNRTIKLDQDGNLETRFTTTYPLTFHRTTGLLFLNLNESTLTVFNNNLQTNLDGSNGIVVNNSSGNVSLTHGNSLQVSNGTLITNISSNTPLISYNNINGVLSSNITTGVALQQNATLPKFDVLVDNKTIKVNSSNQLETNFTTNFPLTFNRTTGTLDLNLNNNSLTVYNNQLQTNLNAIGPINFSNSSGTMSLSTGNSLVVYGGKLFTRMTTSSPMLSVNNSTGNISFNIAGSAPISISGTTVSLTIDNSTLTISSNMLKGNYQAGSGITITGNSIALSSTAQEQIDDAQSTAETAQTTADGAQTLANSANTLAGSANGLASGAVAGVTALEAQLAGATALMTSSIAGLGASIAWSAFGGSLLGGIVGMLFGKRETVSSGSTYTTQGNVVFRDELAGQITSANVLFTLGNILTMNSSNISTATLNIGKGTLGSLFINTSGNIGINNTAPSYKLSISDNSVSIGHQIRVENTNTGNRAGILLKNGTKNGYSIQHDSNGHAYLENLDTSGNMLFYSSGVIGFYDKSMANIERMRIQNSSGNVGIGITKPVHQLDVANGIQSLYNTTSNLKCTNATITNALITVATIGTLYGSLVNVVSTNQATSNITANNITITVGLTSPLSTITTSTLGNVVNTNISTTNNTTTNLLNTYATISNILNTNSTITNLVNNYISTGTIIATNVSTSNLYSSNSINILSTVGRLLSFESTLGNVFIGTSGKVGINNTDPSYTFDVSGIMKSTGLITYDSLLINQSSSTLVNSGLIQTASLYSTNISTSNISTSTLTSSTINSTVLNLNTPSIGATTVLNLNNGNLIGANALRINDPGSNSEGLFFDGGSLWQIAEAPNALGNGTGNLQVIVSGTRNATFETSGNFYVKTNISSAGLITTNITGSNSIITNITSTNIKTTNITSNTLNGSTGTLTNIVATSLSTSNLITSNLTIDNITNSTNLQATTANITSATIGNLMNNFITASDIVNDNLLSISISCGNLDTATLDTSFATTGILKSGIVDTNTLYAVDITTGTILGSYGNINTITSSNVYTEAINSTLGILTNISNSNLNTNNISAGTLTSNTINSSVLNLIGGGDALNLNNANIIGVNSIKINDPGYNEGLIIEGGNLWQISECPNSLTNGAGNLQIIVNGTRNATFETNGNFYVKTNISSSGLITTNITSTNAVITNATISNFKSLYDSNIYNSQANLLITNSTISNLTNTSISSGNIRAVYGNIVNASIGNFKTLYDAQIYNSQENLMITSNTSFNLISSNITTGTIIGSYGDFSNMSIGNFKALYDASLYNTQETLILTNSSISSLHVDNLDIGNLANVQIIVNSNLNGTIANYNITNATISNLRNTYSTITNAILTNASITNLKTTFPSTYSNLLISGATIGNIASLVNSISTISNYTITNATTTNLRNTYSTITNAILTNASITNLITTFPTTYANLNITNATIGNFKTLYDAQIYNSQANLLLTNASITNLITNYPSTYANLNISTATIGNFKTLYDNQIYNSQANLLLNNATITNLITNYPGTYANLNITNATIGNISTLVNNNLRSTITNYLITNNTSTNLRATNSIITNATISNFKSLFDAQIYSSQANLLITNSTISNLKTANIYADSITIGNITNLVNNNLYSSISSYYISNATITQLIGDTLNFNSASISNLITNYPSTYGNLNITNATLGNISTLVNNNLRSTITNYLITNNTSVNIVSTNATITNATISNFKNLFDNQIYNSQANLNITNLSSSNVNISALTVGNISSLVNSNLNSSISNYAITNSTINNLIASSITSNTINSTVLNLNNPSIGAVDVLNLNNGNLIGANSIRINDPGSNNEGLFFDGGSLWQIAEAPNALGNGTGNLQVIMNSSRNATFETNGNFYVKTNISSAGLITTNITSTNAVITNLTLGNFKSLFDNQIYNSQANLLVNNFSAGNISTLVNNNLNSTISNYLITNNTTINLQATNITTSNFNTVYQKSLFSTFGSSISGDIKINLNSPIEFGAGYVKEVNAGKIGYDLFSTNALDIVGGLAVGSTSGTRNVKLWDSLIVDSIKTNYIHVGTSSTMNSFGFPLMISDYQDNMTSLNNSGIYVSAGSLSSTSGYKLTMESGMSGAYSYYSRFSAIFGYGICAGTLTLISDKRGKENIQEMEIETASNIIKNVDIVKYIDKTTKRPHIGVIAQDFEKILPESVSIAPRIIEGKLIEDYKSVDYNYLYNASIVVIKNLLKRVEALEKDIKMLKK